MRNMRKLVPIPAIMLLLGGLGLLFRSPGIEGAYAGSFISTGDGGWEFVKPTPSCHAWNGVFFLDDKTGWVVGDQCAILKTSDGGKNWAPQGRRIGKFLNDVFFTDKDHGWAVGRGPASGDNTGIILKTSDGGATWRVVLDGKTDGFDSVCFANNKVGWAAGGLPSDKGIILKTTDGGETWSEQHVPRAGKNLLRFPAVSFVDELTGYVVACPTGQMVVYKTTNGGKLWTRGPDLAAGFPRDMQFIDANTGWVLNDKAFLRTTDGGKTWVQTSFGKGIPDEKGRFIYSFHFGDSRNGIACMSGSQVFRTRDGGKTWTPATKLTSSPIYGPRVYVADDMDAWIAGSGGMMRTSDGGTTWQALSSGMEGYTFSLAVANPRVIWAAGYSNNPENPQGILLKTEDGGLTWSRRAFTESDRLWRVFFLNDKLGWISSDGGIIFRTTDGGVKWQAVDSGAEKAWGGVCFSDPSNGWVVGGEGTIIRTSDGGKTWTKLNSGTMDQLECVCFFDERTGLACGLNGRILKTTDGGVTWKRKATGTDDFLADMHFIDRQTGWVSGTRGCIFKTIDGGETWARQKSAVEEQLTGICFISAKEGWAGGQRTMVCTTDGGDTWNSQNTGGPVWDVRFTDPNNGLATAGPTILRTTTGGLPGAVWAKKQEDGKQADFGHLVVTKKSEDYLLAEHPDSRVGIHVKTSDTKPNVGDYIYVHGKIAAENGEKIIAADSIDIMCAGWGILPVGAGLRPTPTE